MEGTPIQQLNLGTKMMLREILANDKARCSVELGIIAFDHEMNRIREFSTIKEGEEIPEMVTKRGATHTGTAVNLALDRLEERKAEYAASGVEYYQPWLVLISDGEPYGEDSDITEAAIKRIADLTAEKDLTAYTVGVGDSINRETLARFSPENAPLHVDTIDQFHTLFKWLSSSVVEVASHKPYHAAPKDVCQWQDFQPGGGADDGMECWLCGRCGRAAPGGRNALPGPCLDGDI